MDRIEIYQEIRSMQITYSFHFVFYIILLIEHILMFLKLFWNNNTHLKIFILCSVVDFIFLFYPIIPLILMYRIILKKNLTRIFKTISLILIILSLFFGLLINIFFWINLNSTKNFFRECPFNLDDINKFVNNEDSSDSCGKRRCLLESINNEYEGYPYNYICNYNSQEEFEIDPYTQYPVTSNDGSIHYLKYFIQCQQKNSINELFINKNNINDKNGIYIYLQKCWNNIDINGFYLCQRYELPNKFDVDENYNCPPNRYIVYLYLGGIFLIILDIIIAFILWSLDYKSYSRIILFENNEDENAEINVNNNNEQQRRHNETNTSSNNRKGGDRNNQNENGNENNNQNNNIGSENFERNEYIHQPTETIIIVKDKKTINNSSNIKSSDRLNSGLNSEDVSKSNVNNSNNIKRKNKKGKENIIGSLISQSESQNMISKTSEKENESEDSKSIGKKNIVLTKNNFINDKEKIFNDNEDINFNNNIKYDDYHNNNDEDEKEVENKKEQNNCLIRNKNINLNLNNNIVNNKKQETSKNRPKIKIVLTNDERNNINLKETNNSVKTTIAQKNKEEKIENNKSNNNTESVEENRKFEHIIEDINENYHTKTPKKEIKSLNFNFSQVLTNIRDSDQITLFKNTNGSIIKEERKEETERSIKGEEEEKNNYNKVKNDNKRLNISMLTPLKMKSKSKDKDKNDEQRLKAFFKNDSQSSLIVEESNKNGNHSPMVENNKE